MDERKGTFCIIHKEGLKIDDEHLISPRSFDSWATLLEAAEIRQHEPLLKTARNTREGEVPEIFYHRKCRSKERFGVAQKKTCLGRGIP